ncbi:CynX/NimT family MFS transporter [Actinomyces faecalis]|uniref:MFS transporter n=1 Tax=Actinomyces faecalis TaxID=2722820 RepID=UPI001555CE61|nr:MFS transporter [Actinomyces faecalis]
MTSSPQAQPQRCWRLPRRAWLGVVVLGFLALCSVLRVPIGVVPPLLSQIGTDLAMDDVALGALTSVPVLCFGLMTPLASGLLRRTGANTGGLWTLGLVVAGALVRSAGTTWAAFAGTIVIGAGMTIGNLVAPMIIGRDFWHRTSVMTGMYSATCNVMVTAATALAVPTAVLVGWRGASMAWSVVPALAALVLWLWVFPPGLGHPRGSLLTRSGMATWVAEPNLRAAGGSHVAVWRRPLTWVMAVAFAAHTFSYYAVCGWLPTALVDLVGMSQARAGAAASVFSLTGIVGPLLVPVMFETLRWSGARVMAVLSACWIALPLSLVVAPQAWLVPCVLSGIAQGAFFAALFTLVIQRSANVDENRQTTALIQTCGYVVAALGPVVMGWLRGVSGGWLWPFILVSLVLVVMTVCGQLAARPTRVLSGASSPASSGPTPQEEA